MKTACTRIAIILAALLALGLGSAGRASAQAPAGFSQAELDQMLAPIALYPDTVLSHVLIAATYPLEVVQAARWSRANPGLAGEYAVAAVEHYPWDPSVMALVAFPELLARLDADLEWTQRLGDAFLIQEYQVLDTVQYLRDEAYASGHLRSNEYVRVVRETEYIYIEPSVTRVVYVPWYDPYVVYGNWRWSNYPPVYWHEPSGYRSGFSFHWGSGRHLEYGFFFSAVHWPSHRLVVHDHYGYHRKHDKHYGKRYGKHGYGGPRFASGRELARFDGARHWKHDQAHRRGVAYRRGIDERHTIRAANSSRTADRGHGYDASRNDRRDLLRERSRSTPVQTQRSIAPSADSSRRARHAVERTNRSRSSIRQDSGSILGVARGQSAAADRREQSRQDEHRTNHGSDGRTASPGRSSRDRRSSARSNSSSRHALAQRRASAAGAKNRSSGGDARANRAAVQQRSSVRQSSPRSRAADTRGKVSSRSRRSTGSARPATRGDSQAISRKSAPRADSRARSTGARAKPNRAGTPVGKHSGGSRSRSEILRSRNRDRGR